MPVEYLDPEIANEGHSANSWSPGVWSNTPNYAEEEWQPDIEPPHINDYAAFKKHKHYGKYFRPYRYTPFPAWMYHAKLEPKIVKSREDVLALGSEWSPTPNKPRIDMTGKSLPVKSETQRLAEVVAQALDAKHTGSGGIDATAIGAVVAAVMAAMQQNQPAVTPVAAESLPASDVEGAEPTVERAALIELAINEGVKIDKRWGNDRIKKELGL